MLYCCIASERTPEQTRVGIVSSSNLFASATAPVWLQPLFIGGAMMVTTPYDVNGRLAREQGIWPMNHCDRCLQRVTGVRDSRAAPAPAIILKLQTYRIVLGTCPDDRAFEVIDTRQPRGRTVIRYRVPV